MTVKEYYEAVEGDYAEVISLLKDEERVIKFLKKFAASDAYEKMRMALNNKDYETAFLGAHSLKGMCSYVALTALQSACSELTECIRDGVVHRDYEPFVKVVEKRYKKVIDLIGEIER